MIARPGPFAGRVVVGLLVDGQHVQREWKVSAGRHRAGRHVERVVEHHAASRGASLQAVLAVEVVLVGVWRAEQGTMQVARAS